MLTKKKLDENRLLMESSPNIMIIYGGPDQVGSEEGGGTNALIT